MRLTRQALHANVTLRLVLACFDDGFIENNTAIAETLSRVSQRFFSAINLDIHTKTEVLCSDFR